MDSLTDTPRKRSSRKLTVRFVGDQDVDEFIKPLKNSNKRSQEKEEVGSLATPRSAGRRTPRISQRKTAREVNSDGEKTDEAVGGFPVCAMELDFDEEDKLLGRQLYGFRTPKKDGKIIRNTPSSKLTPKSSNKNKDGVSGCEVNVTPVSKTSEAVKASLDLKNAKTPYNLRKKIKKRIENMMEEDKSDFSSSESEYDPGEKGDSSSDEEAEMEEPKDSLFKTDVEPISTPKLRDHKYVYSPEDYFSSQKSSKSLTSNHTLSRLKTPKISHSMLKDIIQSMESNHRKQITKLNLDHEKYFRKWLFCMRQGHSILLYGLGSKRNTLNSFHQQFLSDCDVVVINGFFPSLSMKKILNCITEEIMDLKSNPAGLLDSVRAIESVYGDDRSEELFLIIHNIDGTTLRNEQSQTILSRLSSIKNVHVIASVDHINSPLLWDPMKLSLFNFLWFDATTMLPYLEETSFENSVMVKQSGALALSSLRSVYNSLTSNAKGVFTIILKYQLEKRGNSNYAGISFRDLYWKSREAFLLSSDLALRAQLTEFVDHHIIKTRTGTDGDERLSIPLDNSILQDFLDEQNE
ncbi:origin recognition complex subunit 2 [Hetaerina americana]|uniref:origin recognition complex subunit 2 n=1 Tax=Hetaerina americana TaxID=62018 RepID=UPI003A7F60EA